MLHLEFRETPYIDTKLEIAPDDESRIPYLRKILENFDMENPAKTFAEKMKRGLIPEEELDSQAQIVKLLAPIWEIEKMDDEQPSLNILIILSRLMQAYANLEKDYLNLEDELAAYQSDEY